MPSATLSPPHEFPSKGVPPSVKIIGRSAPLRQRVRGALGQGEIDCIGEDASVGAAPAAEQTVIVADGGTSKQILTAYRAAREQFPDARVVGIWPSGRRRDNSQVLRTGVDGLVEEASLDQSLAATVAAVQAGLICFPRHEVTNSLVEALSSREKQVLGMLIMGFTNAEIGRRLYLAESTVKSHLSSAYLKLGVRSRKDAAALILDPDRGLGTGILAISPS